MSVCISSQQPAVVFGRPPTHASLSRPSPPSPTPKKTTSRPCSVCVCYSLPPSRLGSKARLIVLQHPHEIRRRLATVPLLSAALEKVDVPRGRRFDGDLRCPPCLREAMAEAEQKKIPVLLLFPGPGALDVKEVAERGIPRWVVEGRESAEEEEEEGERREGGGGAGEEEKEAATTTTTATEEGESKSKPSPPLAFGPVRGGEYILVAVDGTWHQGKQMFRVSFFLFSFVFLGERTKKKTRLSSTTLFFFFAHHHHHHLFFFFFKKKKKKNDRTSPPGSSPLGARRSGSSSRSGTPPRSSARRPPRPWLARRRSEERRRRQQQQTATAAAATATAATATPRRRRRRRQRPRPPPTSLATSARTRGRLRCSRSRSKDA